MQTLEGDFTARDARFAIAVARFNHLIGDRLVEAAVDILVRHGVDRDRIHIARVPGAFELPLAVRTLARTGQYDAIVALGAVIRGATPHFDHVAGACTQGLSRVSLEEDIPIGMGVLTCDSIEQAIERAGTKAGNKGADAALAALEMVSLLRRVRG
jgi:6,7-dimethyl-8-ribityllumazine synthase